MAHARPCTTHRQRSIGAPSSRIWRTTAISIGPSTAPTGRCCSRYHPPRSMTTAAPGRSSGRRSIGWQPTPERLGAGPIPLASSSRPSCATSPGDFQRNAFHALALAMLGQRAAAVKQGEHAVRLAEAIGDPQAESRTPIICSPGLLAAGDRLGALTRLDTLAGPYFISSRELAIDPTWLRSDTSHGSSASSRSQRRPQA